MHILYMCVYIYIHAQTRILTYTHTHINVSVRVCARVCFRLCLSLFFSLSHSLSLHTEFVAAQEAEFEVRGKTGRLALLKAAVGAIYDYRRYER